MTRSGLIEGLGQEAQQKVVEMSVKGFNSSVIADEINMKYNTDFDSKVIRTFLIRAKKKVFNYAKQDKNFQGKIAKSLFDSAQQINELNSELWGFFLSIKKNPELKDHITKCSKCGHRIVIQMQSYGLLLKTANQILATIVQVDKVLGRVGSEKSPLKVEVNLVDLSQKLQVIMPQMLENLKQRGFISKYNKNKFK